MRPQRSTLLSPFREVKSSIYHCVSRCVDRDFKFGDAERDEFVKVMRLYEDFCGVQVLAYVVLSNHWHVMVEVPPESEREEISDEELLRRLSLVSGEDYVSRIGSELAEHRRNHAAKKLQKLRERFTNRMCNLSEFMKMLKWRFSMWFNHRHDRVGTLWEQRFKSVLVEGGLAARTIAAYIDLNPVRAGLVDDPKDFRWCSYGAAMAGDKLARAGLERVMARFDAGNAAEVVADGAHHRIAGKKVEGGAGKQVRRGMRREKMELGKKGKNSTKQALAEYRMVMFEDGEKLDGDRRRGLSAEAVAAVLEAGGTLSLAQSLRCRVRYFTDGAVIGTREFVNEFFRASKELAGGSGGAEGLAISKRKTGARKMKGLSLDAASGEAGGLYALRDLQG